MGPDDAKHGRELGRTVLLGSIPYTTGVIFLVRFSRKQENVNGRKYHHNRMKRRRKGRESPRKLLKSKVQNKCQETEGLIARDCEFVPGEMYDRG